MAVYERMIIERSLPFWQRLLITFGAIVLVSLLASWLWGGFTPWQMPSYLAGVIGGLAALPVWEWLKPRRHLP